LIANALNGKVVIIGKMTLPCSGCSRMGESLVAGQEPFFSCCEYKKVAAFLTDGKLLF
jgi:hypothetical protein